MANKMSTFLAANTPEGFVSFFDELYNPYKDSKVFIIKGGPGTGKSTFMKKLSAEAEKRGFFTQRVYCSSDPDSLDALLIPEKSIVVCDGTAPHVMEPRFPGVCENIINSGSFWNSGKLRESSDEIRRLYFENSLEHTRSSRYLAAAGHIDLQIRKITVNYTDKEKIRSYCSRFVHRELPSKKKNVIGERKRCFLSAISPKGNIFLSDTVKALCPRVIGIDDNEGVVSTLITESIAQGAVKNGYDVICCHCPLKPSECEHLLIPEKGLAIIRISGAAGETECDRVIHSGRFMLDGFSSERSIIRLNSKIKEELIAESVNCLKKAKAIHDSLEEIYIEAMNFTALNEFYENFKKDIFS